MRAGFTAAIAALFVLVSACGGGGGSGAPAGDGGPGNGGGGNGGPPPAANQPPSADAGENFSGSIDPVGHVLNGEASRDPEGGSLTFAWFVRDQPEGANAAILEPDQSIARLRAEVPGRYRIELNVTDPQGGSSADTVELVLYNDAPEAVAEASSMMPAIADEVLLDATGSSDPNGHALTYSWTLTGAPASSGVLASYSGAVVPLQFDVEGEYRFRLTVSDGYETQSTDLGPILVSLFSMRTLNTPFEHVAIQPGGGKVVTVSGRTLAVRDQGGNELALMSLPSAATGIAVSPNGEFAAAAHDGSLTFIDLTAFAVLATYDTAWAIDGMFIDNGGVAHLLPGVSYWANILSINSVNGTTQEFSGGFLYSGTQVKIHPSGGKAYYAMQDVSPSDIGRINIGTGSASLAYDSPYHGDLPFCGKLWMSADGSQILTGCGVIVRATDDPSTDMTYVATLPDIQVDYPDQPGPIVDAVQSLNTGLWYVLYQANADVAREIRIYDPVMARLLDVIDLPVAPGPGGQQLLAKAIWTSSADDTLHVLAQDDAGDPQAYYLLSTRSVSPGDLDYAPVVALQKYSAGRTGEEIVLDASRSYDPEGQSLSYVWRLVSQPGLSPVAPAGMRSPVLSFTPAESGTYVFDVTASDGEKSSQPKTATVHVAAPADPLVNRLSGFVIDAEYSKSLNTLAYILQDRPELVLLSIDGFAEQRVPLPRVAESIGLAPDGRSLAVSHPGLVSLVDLETGTVADTQEHSGGQGDVVLDARNHAHLVQILGNVRTLTSVDFANDVVLSSVEPFGLPPLRLHPNGRWVYTPDGGLSPGTFHKWDVSGMPAAFIRAAWDLGPVFIGGTFWFSEDGESFLTVAGERYVSSDDPDTDMNLIDNLPPGTIANAADHSVEAGLWAIGYTTGAPTGFVGYFRDSDLQEMTTVSVVGPPTDSAARARASWVFLSEDGETTVILSEADVSEDIYSVQVEGP